MKYSTNIDLLLASIIYLATHEFYWARSPRNMAMELALDEGALQRVFEGFPGIFRRSFRTAGNGQHYYALQARYAQKKGGDTSDPEEVSYIKPLDVEKLKLVVDFVVHAAEHEHTVMQTRRTNAAAVAAALISSVAAIAAAVVAVTAA
jgi:hypothetical protein